MIEQLAATYSLGPTKMPPPKSPIYKACYLCGVSDVPLEKEHVIPKVLFAPLSLAQPIVLRACAKCNRDKGFDDEYVTRLLHTTSFSKSGNKLTQDWLRSTRLKRAQSISGKTPGLGIVNGFRDNLVPAQHLSPGGILINNPMPGIKMDVNRINNYFIRIAKGLSTYEAGIIFDWAEYEVNIEYDQPASSNHRMFRDKSHPFWLSYKHATFAREWDDYFSFIGTCTTDPEDKYKEYAHLWSLIAYLSHTVVVLISPLSLKD